MILSDQGIKTALEQGQIEITPPPSDDFYTTSAVDLTIGDQFQAWNDEILGVRGTRHELDLEEHQYQLTSRAYIRNLQLDRDGKFGFPPFSALPSHILAKTHGENSPQSRFQAGGTSRGKELACATWRDCSSHGANNSRRIQRNHHA